MIPIIVSSGALETTDPVMYFLYGMCVLCWTVVYLVTIVHAKKHERVVIPAIAVLLNITWELFMTIEFFWIKLFRTGSCDDCTIGFFCQSTYEDNQVIAAGLSVVWFIFDVVILYYLFKHVQHQWSSAYFKSQKAAILTGGFIVALVLQIVFIECNDQSITGPLDAWIINIAMSACYLLLVVPGIENGADAAKRNNFWVAWAKMIGTLAVSLSMLYMGWGTASFNENYLFVILSGLVIFLLDLWYLLLMYKWNRGLWYPISE